MTTGDLRSGVAVIRYQLAVFGHSQRYLPPAMLYVALLAILNSNNSGPILPGFTLSAGGLLVVAGWFTIALVSAEGQVQRWITCTHTASMLRLLAGIVLAVLVCALGLTLLAVAWAALSGARYTLDDLGVGVLVHLACAGVGIALGLACSELLFRQIGTSVIVAGVTFGVVLFSEWLPIVHPLLFALNHGGPSVELLVRSVSIAAVALVASPLLVGLAAPRLR